MSSAVNMKKEKVNLFSPFQLFLSNSSTVLRFDTLLNQTLAAISQVNDKKKEKKEEKRETESFSVCFT